MYLDFHEGSGSPPTQRFRDSFVAFAPERRWGRGHSASVPVLSAPEATQCDSPPSPHRGFTDGSAFFVPIVVHLPSIETPALCSLVILSPLPCRV